MNQTTLHDYLCFFSPKKPPLSLRKPDGLKLKLSMVAQAQAKRYCWPLKHLLNSERKKVMCLSICDSEKERGRDRK